MFCPFCNAPETKVVDSRLSNEGTSVRRRRECLTCNERFTTFETVELNMPHVVKSDGSRVAFDLEKLRRGLLKALEKRPVSMDKIDDAMQIVIKKTRLSGEREIESKQIGEWVMNELRAMDHVAYVRFASVYRSFQDLDEFKNEIEKLIQVS
ncbi:MAG: transcriptional regulator NrdR [Gammaproteobacteria bacterium]|nr:transcriptional regulator NrdR [Gammaproteobacteria bacterium]